MRQRSDYQLAIYVLIFSSLRRNSRETETTKSHKSMKIENLMEINLHAKS